MKSLLLCCLVILSTLINNSISKDAALETVSKHGKLAVQGTQLVDQSGQALQLKGMSLFWSVWMPQYWTPATIKSAHEGCHSNIVRAAMAVEYDGYLTDPSGQMQMVETVIEAAIANDIYVIADWHDWHGEQHLEQAKGFFDQVSKKYGGYPNLIIYETFNEPLDIDWSSVVKPYHQEIIKVIRANDPDNLILLGSPHYDQELDQVLADPITGQTNIMYTLHFYPVDTKQWLRDRIQNVINNGIPIFISEYGTCAGTGNGTIDAAETALWYQWLDQNQLSYVNWAISDKDESASVAIAGTPDTMICQDAYLSESGRIVVPQNKK
uniref:Endo-beta-1,4-glucanase n=1 Tax=Oncideres albomarginata chamela TaxID=768145 RepID=D7P694_9CUCU|nr:endo-beta-1,4-glucanase precursor [Oncideres albomarginata chamela]